MNKTSTKTGKTGAHLRIKQFGGAVMSAATRELLDQTAQITERLEHLISPVPCSLCGRLVCPTVEGVSPWLGRPEGPRTHDWCMEISR